jgi:sarcosine oxidase gamma subunit
MELWCVDGGEPEAREVEQSSRHTLIEEAGEAAERGLNTLCKVAWELATCHVAQSIFSIQLPTPFWEKHAPLRSRGR